MSITLIILAVGLLLLVWFIYNQKVKFGVAATETSYSVDKVRRYDNVRDL